MDSKPLVAAFASRLCLAAAALPLAGSQGSPLEPYNTVKTELAAGQYVVGATVVSDGAITT